MQGQISIANLILQETGTYNTQVSRPYEAVVTGDALDQLGRRIEAASATDPFAKINGSLVAGMSHNLVSPSASWEKEIIIPNGWNEHRLRFLMEVHVTNNFGVEIYYFQGYTDHTGISLQGTIDPDMPFFINSYVLVNRAHDYSGLNSGGFRDVVARAEQVIDGRAQVAAPQQGYQAGTGALYALRPEDLFTGVHSNYLTEAMVTYDGATVLDTRIDHSKDIMSSRRMNGVPSSYLCRVIDNYRQASTLADYGNGQDDIYSRAIQTSYEGSPYDNIFIRRISEIQGVPCSSYFTMNDLAYIDSTVNQRTSYHTLQQTTRLHQVGDTDDNWKAATLETQLATVLTHAVSALMLSSMLIQVGFVITNMTIDGSYQTQLFPETQSISNVNNVQHHANFVQRLETEVMPDITMNGQIPVNVIVYSDLYGETEIQISLNGAPHQVYVTPSFCDALMSPVTTVNQNNYNGLISGIEEIINYCSPNSGGSNITII